MRRLSTSLAVWIAYLVVSVVVLRRVPSPLEAALLGGAGIGLVGLARVWFERWLPPRFDVTPSTDSVTFSFRDLSLGYEFRALNPTARDVGGLTRA